VAPGREGSFERSVGRGLGKNGQLGGPASEGAFIDVGRSEALTRTGSDMAKALQRPAVFFDRDGVLNHDKGYTHRREDFHWVEGAPEAIRLCNDAGFYVFVVTNQAGIARGYYDASTVEALHRWMNQDLKPFGAHIDDFRYCPHHPEGVVEEFATRCECRKPAPGMILDLAAAWPLDLSRSFLVGDKESDLAAARAAGIDGILFRGGLSLPGLVNDVLEGRRSRR
jgi:D,D-heptose 1,7-bisphosphate phosphatase